MQEYIIGFTEAKSADSDFFILEALQSINKSHSIINERLEKLLMSELPDHIKLFLNDAHMAEINAQQTMLKLALRCLKDFPKNEFKN